MLVTTCTRSPTTHHHWMVEQDNSSQKCKYCDKYESLRRSTTIVNLPSLGMFFQVQ